MSGELTEGALKAAAGSTSFVRGEDYVRYVHGLRVTESGVAASIQAQNVYLVDLQWSHGLNGHCTCPHHAAGNFCKHLVALGLAVLASEGAPPRVPRRGDRSTTGAVPGVQMDAPARSDIAAVAPDRLVDLVNATLRTRGVVDYRRSLDLAAEAQLLLDQLEEQVLGHDTRIVQALLLRALSRLRTITERADDSSGLLSDACQRAGELYARACRAGHPDPPKLARWLLKFRDTSPGWPDLELRDFLAAFDDKALKAYRSGVARLDQKYAGADWFERAEVDRMRLELADHDGDVDQAVAILSQEERPAYGAIVERLNAAGRDAEASEWIDRAVASGRVSSHAVGEGNDFWLDPSTVAADLLARDRADDAIEVLRCQVPRSTDIRPYRALLDFVTPLGLRDLEEAWAQDHLRQLAAAPHGNGALLVQIALADGDLAAAWSIADELGAGHAWEALANASTSTFPGKAAVLHREHVDGSLRIADSSRYPGIAAALTRIGELMERAGEHAEFVAYVGQIRQTYGRRPSLMAALDRRGLP